MESPGGSSSVFSRALAEFVFIASAGWISAALRRLMVLVRFSDAIRRRTWSTTISPRKSPVLGCSSNVMTWRSGCAPLSSNWHERHFPQAGNPPSRQRIPAVKASASNFLPVPLGPDKSSACGNLACPRRSLNSASTALSQGNVMIRACH